MTGVQTCALPIWCCVLPGQSGCEALLVLRAWGPGHQTSHNAWGILYSEELSGLKADTAHAKKHQPFHHEATYLGGLVSSVFLKPMEAVVRPWGESSLGPGSQRAPLSQAVLAAWDPPPSCAHAAAPSATPRGSQPGPSLSVRGTLNVML